MLKMMMVRRAGRVGVAGLLWALALAGQSCVLDDTRTVECRSGLVCSAGWICAAAQEVCIKDGCGDGFVDRLAGEACDDGNIVSGDGCSEDCRVLEGCGNGFPEDGELCDDGNNESGDGCSADCLSTEECGNGHLDVGEACDDGNMEDTGSCSADCSTLFTCGDGIISQGEVCDDEGDPNGGCSDDCLSNQTCGNGYLDIYTGMEMGMDEECDRGGDHEQCDGDCTVPMCGDGYTNPAFVSPEAGISEECDDGVDDTETCDSDCTLPACGDGHLNMIYEFDMLDEAGNIVLDEMMNPIKLHEECDDGNASQDDGCIDNCVMARCGDGFVWVGVEDCDLADWVDNPTPGDTSTCNYASGMGAHACQFAVCGDGYKNMQANEACDDGSDSNDCDGDCTLVACGDSYLNSVAGEECDDGNTTSGDGCSSQCQVE